MVFKTTCVDRRISLREGAFFFTRMTLFLPLNKRNAHDKAKGLYISSERYIGMLDVRCLSTEKRHSHRMPKSEFYGNVLCIGLGLRLSIQAIATISLRYSADEPLVSLPSGIGVADLEDSRGGAGAYA